MEFAPFEYYVVRTTYSFTAYAFHPFLTGPAIQPVHPQGPDAGPPLPHIWECGQHECSVGLLQAIP